MFSYEFCEIFKSTFFTEHLWWLLLSLMSESILRGGSRTAATSKMEQIVIIVNRFQPLTIITKCSVLDVAAVLDPPMSLSTQILNLTIGPLSFISSSILCQFAMLPNVYILLSPQKEEVHSFWGDRCTPLAAYSSKRLNPLSVILVCLGNT